MNFQTIFFENESLRSLLIETAENAAAEAGYLITVNPHDGSFSYDDEDSYNSQEEIYSVVNEAVSELEEYNPMG